MNVETIATDKDFLRSIVKNNFKIPNSINTNEFCLALMPNLQSSDGELRDDLSYSILSQVLKRESFTARAWSNILEISLSNDYLFHDIGESGTNSVYVRSFAVLIVAAVIEFDARRKLLSKEQVQATLQSVLHYTRREHDYRGYIENHGWAHSVAHMSYALDSCAHHPFTSKAEHIEILNSIFSLATLPVGMNYMEADHLSRVIFRMLKEEQLSMEELCDWIQRFNLELDRTGTTVVKNVNASDFLKSLYFLMHWEMPAHPLIGILSESIKRLNIWYRYGISFES